MDKRLLIIICMLAMGVALLPLSTAQARITVQTLAVTATVNTVNDGLSLGLNKVVPAAGGDTWTPVPITSGMAFGTLTLDPDYKIFKAANYFAVDVGVLDNSGSTWTLTHTVQSVKKDATNNLDSNINVTFVKQKTNTTYDDLTGGKVTFAGSNNKAYTKTQLTGGWLRIYYGIATGNTDSTKGVVDNPGATPITLEKPAGTYTGSVTITLAP